MTCYDDLLSQLQEVHAELIKAIDGLPPEALDWTPDPEMNSLCMLVVHLLGAERYWIGDVALGKRSNRDRAAEFESHGLGMEELQQRITAADEFARQALARLAPVDMETPRQSPRNDKTFSIGWCLMHTLEHSALHLGHVQLTRQLWDQKVK